MTIEQRKNAVLEKIAELKSSGGEEQLKELDEAYKKGVDSL
ncbi:unknown [Firmicutes bacterium CAG:110]|nr:unknown [Firmicutes bacterium CAG:110]